MGVPGNANALLLRSAAAAGGYQVSRSLRFNSSDSAYLSRAVPTAGNRKTWTLSLWVKRGTLTDGALFHAPTTTSGTAHTWCNFTGDTLQIYDYTGSSFNFLRQTTQVFRDPSAWYHLVFSVDSDNATAANRARIYVNGSEVTTWASTSTAAAGFSTAWNNNVTHQISSQSQYFNGYLADIYFIDGQALTPSSFTEVSATTGQLIPKAYTGSFGTNGFWLKFSDNSNNTAATLGKDYSGNSNNWTPNNLSVTAGAGNDSLVDTPTSYGTDTGAGGEVRGNYCTLNPLQSSATLSNGNLDCSTTSTSWQANVGTVFQSSGKWYAEFTVSSIGAGGIHIGIVGPNYSVAAGNYIGNTATSYAYRADGTKFNNATQTSYGASYTTNDVIGVAMNLDAGTLVFYKNGVSQGTAYSGMTGEKAFAVSVGSTTGTHSVVFNAGSRPFAYTAPSGFKALCDTNLPAPVVAKPNTVFDIALWTGDGATTRSITGLNFAPDFVWASTRSDAWGSSLVDAVRGVGANGPTLRTFNTAAEETSNLFGVISALNSNGFTLSKGSHGTFPDSYTNKSGQTYVAWAWDAGSSTVTNTQGSITSSVRANASAGFSIVTYTGTGANATVGHGLGVAPFMFIVKNRSTSSDWDVYHGSLPSPATNRIVLQSTAAAIGAGGTSSWNSTSPTSTVVSLGSSTSANSSGSNHVMYCFAPVTGYSSFGSYTGNGSSQFVYLGFRPRWLLIKNAGQANDWFLMDSARSTYNEVNTYLYPNTSGAEATYGWVDFLSNGFKVNNTGTGNNNNGITMVYAAFAESPFQYARAR